MQNVYVADRYIIEICDDYFFTANRYLRTDCHGQKLLITDFDYRIEVLCFSSDFGGKLRGSIKRKQVIMMPYIPKEHEKYDLLPYCRKGGGEVFEYLVELIDVAEKLMDSSCGLMPYYYESYDAYFNRIDSLIVEHSENSQLVEKLKEIRDMVWKMNQKEEWSVLKYIGPTDDAALGLTHGKNYYWPSCKENPVYCGVIDDEEFTAYLYPTEADLWEILEDPTGMAYRTIYEDGKG